MNIGELISAWEKDYSWVGKTPNPFIKKMFVYYLIHIYLMKL